MADYSIELGVKLRTSDIDAQINKYSKNKLIKVKAELDPSNITSTLNSFKGKSIDVNTKLSTRGITEAIKSYKAKEILVQVEPDFSGLQEKIQGQSYKTPLTVGVELNWAGVASQIANPKLNTKSGTLPKLNLGVELDDSAVNSAIQQYKKNGSVKSIPIKIEPVFDGFDAVNAEKLLEGYKARVPLKVEIELNKTQLNNQIKEFNSAIDSGDSTKAKVQLKAEFKNDAIANAISAFKTAHADKLVIPIDLTLQNNESLKFDESIKQKIDFYKKSPISIATRLVPASKNFISDAIGKAKIPITATLQNPQEISRAINAYVEKPVSVKAQLVPAKNFDGNITKTPIKVHATLLPDEIDDVINYFTPKSKIKVGVELNKQEINSEIKKLPKPTDPLEVNVELNQSSINKAIANAKPASLLKVGIDLQDSDVNAQIEKMHPTSKVKVYLDLDDKINEEAKKQSGQTPINVNVKLDRDDINKQIREFKTNSKIKVGVKLDFASHEGGQKGIPQQIKDYKTSAKIKVGAQLDKESVDQSIQGLTVNAPIPLRIELEQNSVQNVKSQIDNLRQQIQSLGNININLGGGSGSATGSGNRGSGKTNNITKAATAKQRALRSTYKLYKDIESMELKLGKLDMSGIDSSEIVNYRNQLNELRQTYENLLATLSGQNGAINLGKIGTEISEAKTSVAELSSQIDNARTKLAEDVKLDVKNGELNNQIESVKQKFNQLGIKSQEVENEISELQSLLKNMDTSDDIESVTSDYQKFLQVLQTVDNRVDGLKMDIDEANRPEILNAKKEEAMQRLNGLFDEGSQASKRFGSRAEELRRELNQVGNVKGVDIVNKKIKNLGTEIKNSHVQTKTLGVRLKEQFSRYSNYLSIASVIMYGTQAMRSMFEQVKLIDSAMTELKKVTDETDESYNKFLDNAATRAKEIGTTIDGLVKSTADFARLGYGFEDAQGLAEVANIYAVVGDEVEGVEGATESLISTMAAFKDEANGIGNSNFAMGIIDKFNEIGNKFAISSGGIGEAMMRSASSLEAANNTIDESIALITAANTVVQNPDKVGNAFKTISMRIRGAKTELEEAGESTEGMAESTASMRKEIMALSGVDIMLNENTFKSTYQVMDELSQKWENLSDIAQASIIELMAGKHQGNVFASLMKNFDVARDALEVSAGSAGSAMQEHAKWSESLEARLLKLKAAWQSLSQTFMNSDFLKIGIDFIIKLIDFIDKLIDKVGVFPTLLGGFGLFKIYKSFKKTDIVGGVKRFSDVLSILSNAFPRVSAGADKVAGAFRSVSGASAGAGGVISKLSAGLGSLITPMSGVVIAAAAMAAVVIAEKKKIEDLADSVEETTSKYREQHEELLKLKDDYDTTNEDSMISKYEELSKGVNDLGENLSLTSDEYSEYQSIIDTIANQFPDLVTGYNSQGTAILNLADGVDTLTQSYKDLIKEQNNEVLEAGKDIFKDFNNDMDKEITSQGIRGLAKDSFTGTATSHLEALQDIFKSENIVEAVNSLSSSDVTRISKLLEDNGISRNVLGDDEAGWENQKEFIIRAVKENAKEVKSALSNAWDDINAHVEDLNTYTSSYLSTAFLGGDDNNIGDYSHLSERMQNIISQITSGFDASFYEQFGGVEELEEYLDSMLGKFSSKDTSAKLEAAFDLRTQFNGGEITYGEYVNGIKEAEELITGLQLDEEIENQLKLSLNTEEVNKNYKDLSDRLSSIGIESKEFLAGLSSSEYAVAVDLILNDKIDLSNFNEDSIKKYIEEQANIQEALTFNASIDVDKTALETFNKALEESASAMGISSESMESLKAKYGDLESYNIETLFEKTANGVKLNKEEVAKLEKEYNDLKKTEVQEHLDTLTGEYNRLTSEIDKCTNASERAQLMSERDGYVSKIQELAEYQAQLEGVTGAYQRWIDAQNTPESYEGYQAVATSRKDVKDEIDRGFISESTKAYIDLLAGEDLVGATIDEYASAWERLDDKVGSTSYSIHDFFTVNDDGDITATGIDRFFDGIQTDFKDSIYKLNKETGEYYYDFSAENLQKVQDQWGMGIEAIELMLEAAESAGYNVDWGGIFDDIDLDVSDFETLVAYAEKAQETFNKLKDVDDVDFNFTTTSVEAATSELEKAKSVYTDLITNDDGSINLKANGADEMRVILSTLLVQKQQLEDTDISMNIDTSGLDASQQDIADAIEAVKTFREKYKNLEIAITTGEGISTAKTELNNALGDLQKLGDDGIDIAAQLILGEGSDAASLNSKIDEALAIVDKKKEIPVGFKLDESAVGTLNSELLTNFTPEATVKITEIDDSLVEGYTSTEKTANGTVTWDNDDKLVVQFQNKVHEAKGTVEWENNTTEVKTRFSANGTVNWTSGNKVKVNVISEANGTANADGTTGRAFKQGDWGIKGSGTALVGELGMETLVRDGRFYTIGDNGAEFINYKQGDIIFNHKQTEELFKNGKVTSGGGRGKAFVDGSAYPSSGRAFAWESTAKAERFASKRTRPTTSKPKTPKALTKVDENDGVINVNTTVNANVTESNFAENHQENGVSSVTSSSSSSSAKDEQEFKETLDWIETKISRIERVIDQLDTKANSVYRSWSERNSALSSQINEVGNEIDIQQQAYDRYLKEANSVGLSESWASKVRSGAIDISTITDEDLKEKIDNYKNWYEKALDCQGAILDLKETESELYAQRFENIQSQYDGILQGYEHTETMLNEYISQAEEQGYIVSKKYYQALIDNEKSNIAELKKEQSDLIAKRDEAVASGKIVKGSEEWHKMCNEIDSVTQAIEEGTTSLLEYANAMREIDWKKFDIIQERISDVTSESDFLIELMSNKDLYDDNGNLTGRGAATLGLHGLNHNTYMYQADEHQKEINELDKQIAKNPHDQELVNRRRELVELQRESILAAEDEKEAIRDLVEEGINIELDALQERIDLHNEELDSMKNLYDYQKNVEKQTKNIASLRKQLNAYENDNSEEAKAKIQELRVSLAESEAELKETEYDKYISDQSALLDSLYTEYELILNTRLDNIDELLGQVVDGINAAMGADGTVTSALGADGAIAQAIVRAVGENGSIKSILNTEATNVGTTLSTAMNNVWTADGSGKTVIDLYGKDFQSKSTTTNDTLSKIKTDVSAMVDDIDKDAQKKVEAPKTTTSAVKNPITGATPTSKPSSPSTSSSSSSSSSSSGGDGKPKIGDKVKFISGKYYYDSSGTSPAGSKNQGKEVYITNINTRSWATHPYHISTGKKLGSGDLGWLKLSQISGYAYGRKNLPSDETAWTQENGKEFIIRPSDGAILTPLAKGDSVLNANASSNIWSMANNPSAFIKDNLNLGATNIPNNSNVNNNITQNVSANLNFPNVKSYEETLIALSRDPKFQKLVNAMTTDQYLGKSSLAKGKAIK